MKRFFALLIALFIWALPASAQRAQDIDALFDALDMQSLFQVMQQEGVAFGDTLANDMLPGGSGPGWRGIVRRLHDPDSMEQIVRQSFEESFGGADAQPLITFFRSDLGQKIVQAEIAARLTFLDEAAEEAARERFRALSEPYDARMTAIADYIRTNDLVDYNVVGAMNANYMFFRGLVEGGAIEMSEEDMLRDVWAQEGNTRLDTQEWLFAFLMAAYGALDPAEIEAYVDLSRTPEGRAFNRALFAGFDQMYGALSLSIGLALARQMQGENL